MDNAEYLAEAINDIAPNACKQLTDGELEGLGYANYAFGWRITLDSLQMTVTAPNVNYLIILVDNNFPNSQIRVVVPQLGSNFIWPHTEQNGFLCLRPTLTTADVKKRVRQHFNDAIQVLNYSKQETIREFTREFIAYWRQNSTENPKGISILSLVNISHKTEDIFYFYIPTMKSYVFAESKDQLNKWLRNIGININNEQIYESKLWILKKPWVPSEFPNNAAIFVDNIKKNILFRHAKSKKHLPLLIKTNTQTGTVFVAVLLEVPDKKRLIKGFRSLEAVSECKYKNNYRNQKIDRFAVQRIDASWVHGRDHNPELSYLLNRKVLLVGCGSLGSKIAKTLCEAGVGELCFIDSDNFESHNMSRHQLGYSSINRAKSIELARELANKYPHLKFDHIFVGDFQQLNKDQLQTLMDIDLIISAGISYEGELAVDGWRKSLKQPPLLISSWVEPYALAGHAVLIINKNSLLERFTNENPDFNLIRWPDNLQLEITEAGCGNTFQPHGTVDLNYTANMAAKCALNALLSIKNESVIYSWLGNKNKIEILGGFLIDPKLSSNSYLKRKWDNGL